MIVVVYGGNASGKSVLAEKIALKLLQEEGEAALKEDTDETGDKVLYLATMRHDGSPSYDERVEKHRQRRGDKWFRTLECTANLREVIFQNRQNVILLEDAGNLTANVLFPGGETIEEPDRTRTQTLVAELMGQIDHLISCTKHLVVVTNNIFDGGIILDQELNRYTQVLGELNQYLALRADVFMESVCGLPHILKGEKQAHFLKGLTE